jgi:hypothetical protein
MIVIARRLAGVLPYRAIYFPSEKDISKLTSELRPTEMMRLFYTQHELAASPTLIRRETALTVLNDLREPADRIWRKFERFTRQEIRQAERLGDRVEIISNGPAPLHDFLSVYNAFATSKPGVWALSRRAAERYACNSDVRVLYLDGQPAVVNMVMRDPEASRVRGIFSASRRLEAADKKNARIFGHLNRLLHWRNMLLYQEQGFATYDWGGVTPDAADGIAKFKRSFGGQLVRENVYLCARARRLGVGVLLLYQNLSARGRHLRRALREQAATTNS